jgi:hypothetical protein
LPDSQPVQQDVRRAGGCRAGGCGAGGRGDLAQDAGLLRFAGPERGAERLQVRLAREAGVERFQAAGRADQQPCRLVPAPLLQRDLTAQVLCLGGAQFVRRPGVDRGQQVQRRVEGAGVADGPRRVEQPLRAAARIGRQRGGPVEIRGRRGQAAASLRPARGAGQFGRDVLVRTRRPLGPVPGAAVRVGDRVGSLRPPLDGPPATR